MNQPLVSIILPVYNAQNHLARCVGSICAQTYRNIEIIILNDGSKDQSLPVCEEFRQKDPRILLVDKANSGVSDTRNLGLKLASGKYVEFVDSDDYLDPDFTERLVAAAEAEGVPYQLEAEPSVTGTDARAIQVTRGGIPTGLISVPLRYMHTPTEVICLRDLEATVRLITRFAQDLAPDTSFVPGLGGAVTENAEGKAAGADADADADASDASAAPEGA